MKSRLFLFEGQKIKDKGLLDNVTDSGMNLKFIGHFPKFIQN